MRSELSPSARPSTTHSGWSWWKKAPWMRLTPRMPSASDCSALSLSSMRTCMTTSLGSAPGCSCRRMPTQPWHSFFCLKLRAVTVAA